jgi:hypothetical protein
MLQNCASTFNDECEFTNIDNSTVKHQTDYQVSYSRPNHLLLVSPAAYHIQNACYTTTPYRTPTYTPSHLPIPYTYPSMSNNEHDSVTTTFLDRLHRDYNEGTLNAIVYMEDLWDFTQDCQHKEAEWKADQRAEIRSNHNIQYPKHNYLATLRSWDTFSKPGSGLPRLIQGSCPICLTLKQYRYRNACTPRYHILQPHPPQELDSDITPNASRSSTM